MMNMADLHDSTEHYLATIFKIQEDGIEIKRARIAERLRISAPSVTEHIHRMEKQGLVYVDENNSVSLSEEGRIKASSVVRRHRLAERLLVDVIGLDWALAHREADRWEHVISDEVESKLVALLGDPETCPHGNPIPGKDGSVSESVKTAQRSLQPLNTIAQDQKAVIQRIGERIETNDDSLNFVSDNKIIPGMKIAVVDTNDGTVTVSNDANSHVVIPKEISHAIFVELV
jgi:DtxR family Mn-dependent transcriptional regulator